MTGIGLDVIQAANRSLESCEPGAVFDFRLISAVMPLSRFRDRTSVLNGPRQSTPDDVEFAPPEECFAMHGNVPQGDA
jgi:hypothetical protein